jgi:diguanylate cyclase (GGDEF)-like protein
MWTSLASKGEWKGEIWNRKKSGEVYPELLTINSIKDNSGTTSHYVAVFKDISEIKDSEEKLRLLAFHDALTSLPNRTLFLDRLKNAIVRAERVSGKLAILFLDMDNFKNINDILGHFTGDKYLQIIAERLSTICRDEDSVARLGGDEFVILIPEIGNQHGIAQITNRILRELEKPLVLNEHKFKPSASIGVAFFPEDGKDASTLMKNADLAMYKSKENGKGVSTLFNDEMNKQLKKKIRLEELLRSSLKNNEMTLLYQPKVSISNRDMNSAEALLRWNSKELGMVSPSDFIPIAEETGFILELGDWVLQQALRDLSDFQKVLSSDFEMAVNLSASQFHDKKLVTRIEQIIQTSQIDPSTVNLEITENMAMEESNKAIDIINRIKELGLSLSIDDFGTGYSSYNYLKQYKAKYLKIDKSFVDEIPEDKSSGLILKNIINLGHILNMEVIAEGVETEDQFHFLKSSNCDIIQGYYFSKPLSKEELIRYGLTD